MNYFKLFVHSKPKNLMSFYPKVLALSFGVCRSSRLQMFFTIDALKNFIPVLESLFDKVGGLKVCNLLKRESKTGVFL